MVSAELCEELKNIVMEDYGEELSSKQAAELAEYLVGYFDVLGKIYHRERDDYG